MFPTCIAPPKKIKSQVLLLKWGYSILQYHSYHPQPDTLVSPSFSATKALRWNHSPVAPPPASTPRWLRDANGCGKPLAAPNVSAGCGPYLWQRSRSLLRSKPGKHRNLRWLLTIMDIMGFVSKVGIYACMCVFISMFKSKSIYIYTYLPTYLSIYLSIYNYIYRDIDMTGNRERHQFIASWI